MEIPFTNIRITQNTDKISEITPLFDKAIQEYKQLIKICSDDEFFKLKDEVLDIISQHKISVTKQNLINYFDKLYKDVDKIIRTNINFIDINKVKKELIDKRILEKIDNETELFTHYNDEMYKVNDDVKEHFFVEIDKIKHVANMMAQSKHFSIENNISYFTQKEKKDFYNDKAKELNNNLSEITKYTDNISSYINCSDLLEIVNNGYRLFLLEHKENIYNYFFVFYLKESVNKEFKGNIEPPIYTYVTIFKNQSNAQKLKEFFNLKQLTVKGVWQENKDLQNLASFFYYLQDVEIIKKDITVKYALEIFYKEFGVTGEYNTISRVSNKFLNKRILQDYLTDINKYFSIK